MPPGTAPTPPNQTPIAAPADALILAPAIPPTNPPTLPTTAFDHYDLNVLNSKIIAI